MIVDYTRPHELAQLHDEIVAAVPALVADVAGRRTARFALWDDGETIYVDAPNELADAIAAVVAAHVAGPAPPPVSPPPDAVTIAHALVQAVTAAPDFATAQANLAATAAELPKPEGG